MPNPIRPSLLHLSLPEDVRTRLDLLLHSDLEGRVPKGAYQRFFIDRITEFFSWTRLDLSLYGYPQGFFISGPKEMVDSLRSQLERISQP
jgi:hypothetical protein